MNEIQVVIPSRKRPQNMQKMMKLVPFANVCVHQSEYDDYVTVVPKGHLKTHNCVGMTKIRKHIVTTSDADCVIQMDDDLFKCISLCGQKVITYTDSKDIWRIFYNTYSICKDLDIKMFGYNTSPSLLYYTPFDPIKLNLPAFGCFGILDKTLYPDQNLLIIDDTDVSLQCLYRNRIIFTDFRFCFTAGQVYNSPGGQSDLRVKQNVEKDNLYYKAKWGKYYRYDSQNGLKNNISVPRKNQVVQKR